MSVTNGLLIFLSILAAYFLLVFVLHKQGILKKYNVSFYGPALLLRTKKGRDFLKKVSSKKRFWKAFGSSGIVLCFVAMVLMTAVIVWQALFIFGLDLTAEQKQNMPGPEFALALPGINPILPMDYFFYIILALAIAIVVHEFSHGILTFASKLKVKSLGILYLIVPLGAFCEPDEEQLKETKISNRMRVYAAGPTSNFVVALVVLLLFSFVFMASVQPAVDGIGVLELYENSPADQIGLKTGSIITSINGSDLTDAKDFADGVYQYRQAISKIKANDTVSISFYCDNTFHTKDITFISMHNYSGNISHMEKGHPGIYTIIGVDENLNYLKNPFADKSNFIYLYILPLTGYLDGYNPIASPFTESYEITGPLSSLPTSLFWGIVNALYWIFWLNLAVAIFNVLPMIPLDGGFLFNDAIRLALKKIKKDIKEETRDKIVKNISLVVSLTILFLAVSPFFVKYF